jgi:hypothetical protein
LREGRAYHDGHQQKGGANPCVESLQEVVHLYTVKSVPECKARRLELRNVHQKNHCKLDSNKRGAISNSRNAPSSECGKSL